MRRRRIFRPAANPRRWGTTLVAILAVGGALMVAVALPGDLFGSAPRDQSWSALAADVRVLDGDTLRLGDRTVRLFGLLVPERGARCSDAGRAYDCGAAAAAALARMVAGRGVVCQVQARDRHARALATCRSGDSELNAALVAGGWALADAAAAPTLAPLEAAARTARRGLWSGGFQPPESWRVAH